MAEGTSYRFEPLERRGLLLGLGLGQLAVLAVALIAAVGLAKTWPGGGGFVAAAGALAVGGLLCRPILGRPPTQWLSVAVSFGSRRKAVRVPPPSVAPTPTLCLPARTFAPGVFLCVLPGLGGPAAMGAVLDERSGTAAALLRARGGPFCLLDEKEKDHRLAAWAAVLESVSAQRSSLARLQWCQRTVPADNGPLVAHLRSAGDRASPGFDGHALLLERAGQRSWCHETLIVVAVRCRSQRGHRGPTTDGAEALRNEVRALRSQMRSAGFLCDGVLDAAGGGRGRELPRPGPQPPPWRFSLASGGGRALVRGTGRRVLAQDLLGRGMAPQPRRAGLPEPAASRDREAVVFGGDGSYPARAGGAGRRVVANGAGR